jgi:hypothetical protein
VTRLNGAGAYKVSSDVYTYVTRLSSVDSNNIILWGLSFGSVVSACCAAVDRTYLLGTPWRDEILRYTSRVPLKTS